jgi:hypothetical protein
MLAHSSKIWLSTPVAARSPRADLQAAGEARSYSQRADFPILLARSRCKNVLFEMRISNRTFHVRIRATQVRSEASGSHLPFHHGFLRRFVEMDLGVHVIDPFDRDEVRSAAGVRVILRQDDQVGTFLVVDRADMLTI